MALPQRKNEPSVDQPNPGRGVRNVQMSGFGYLSRNETASNDNRYNTVDSTFKDSDYGNSDRILKPTGLGNKEKWNAKDNQEQVEAEQISEADEMRAFHRENTRRRLGKQKLPAPLAKAKTLVARTKASTINSAAISWQGPLWLTFQLPMAIFNIITFATAAAIDSMANSDGNPIQWVVGKLTGAALDLAKLVGIDFAEIALGLFFITELAIIGFGIASIFFLYLQYTMAGLKPFSGTHAGLKIGALLLVIIGYSIPGLNMLPVIFLWMAVVWLYPR